MKLFAHDFNARRFNYSNIIKHIVNAKVQKLKYVHFLSRWLYTRLALIFIRCILKLHSTTLNLFSWYSSSSHDTKSRLAHTAALVILLLCNQKRLWLSKMVHIVSPPATVVRRIALLIRFIFFKRTSLTPCSSFNTERVLDFVEVHAPATTADELNREPWKGWLPMLMAPMSKLVWFFSPSVVITWLRVWL